MKKIRTNLFATLMLCMTLTVSGCLTQDPVQVVDKSSVFFGRDHQGRYVERGSDDEITSSSLAPLRNNNSSTNKESTMGFLVAKKKQDPKVIINENKDTSVEERNSSNSKDLTYVAPKKISKTTQSTSKDFLLKTPINSNNFEWPVVGGEVLARFGKNGNKFNEGINIAAPLGTPVTSAGDGKVVYIGNNIEGYGNLIIIKHANDFMTAYSHIGNILVERGVQVKKGEGIAAIGKTGNVTKPQLHFSVRKGKKTIDPEKRIG